MKLETKWKLINKVSDVLLYVISLAFFLAYSYGIICHAAAISCIGLLGIMAYIPLWCYLTNILDKRERKACKAHEGFETR